MKAPSPSPLLDPPVSLKSITDTKFDISLQGAILLVTGTLRSTVALSLIARHYSPLHLLNVNWGIPNVNQYTFATLTLLASYYNIEKSGGSCKTLTISLSPLIEAQGGYIPTPTFLYAVAQEYAHKRGVTEVLTSGRHSPNSVLAGRSDLDIFNLGMVLQVPYAMTSDCPYVNFHGESCGVCPPCITRKQLFQQAGVKDYTLYQQKTPVVAGVKEREKLEAVLG